MNRAIASLVAGLGLAHAALGQHRDINILVEDDQLTTGAINLDLPGEPIESGIRVFPGNLGEGIAHFTDDPGFNAPSGELPSGASVGFDILDALWKWNPATQRFDTLPPETLFVGLSVLERTTPVTPATLVTGFNFAVVGGGGGIHQHINFFLNPPQNNGIYIYVSRVTISAAGIGASDPIYIVLNESEDTEVHDDAMAFAVANITNPGCPGDVNSDGSVDFDDLNNLLGFWDQSGPIGLSGDITLDGRTDFDDLNTLLANWGNTCP